MISPTMDEHKKGSRDQLSREQMKTSPFLNLIAILGVNFPCGKSTQEEILPQILYMNPVCCLHQNCKIHPTHTLLKLKLLFKSLLRVVLAFRRKREQRECLT